LLEKGADVNFVAVSGNWSRSSEHSILSNFSKCLEKISKLEWKTTLLKKFVDSGVDLNKKTVSGKQGNFGGHGGVSYDIIRMVEQKEVRWLSP